MLDCQRVTPIFSPGKTDPPTRREKKKLARCENKLKKICKISLGALYLHQLNKQKHNAMTTNSTTPAATCEIFEYWVSEHRDALTLLSTITARGVLVELFQAEELGLYFVRDHARSETRDFTSWETAYLYSLRAANTPAWGNWRL